MEDIHSLVAHFLQQQGYTDTLEQFEKDYGRAIKPQPLPYTHETLVEIVNDRIQFEQLHHKVKSFELDQDDQIKHNIELMDIINHQIVHWSVPFPHTSVNLGTITGNPISMTNHPTTGHVFIATSDRKLYDFDVVRRTMSCIPMESIFKVVVGINDGQLILVGMDGKFYRYSDDMKLINSIQAHKRLVVDVKYVKFEGTDYVVSLGWDNMLKIFKLGEAIDLVSELTMRYSGTAGTSIDVTAYNDQLMIVVAKSDITLLDVITFKSELQFQYNISINDAEFSSTGFSPRHLSIQHCQGQVPLVAIATSHEPYMRLIIVSLNQTSDGETTIHRNQILKNINTLSPQHKLSQPLIQWRAPKNGKSQGVWVMGDDGKIRTIDLLGGESESFDGHDGAIKHCVTCEGGTELFITCGMDKMVKMWTC